MRHKFRADIRVPSFYSDYLGELTLPFRLSVGDFLPIDLLKNEMFKNDYEEISDINYIFNVECCELRKDNDGYYLLISLDI